MLRELFDVTQRPLFGQADPLALDPLPMEETLGDLGARFAAERLDPGDALAELVAFAAGHPQRTMLLAYLLSDRLATGEAGTAERLADHGHRIRRGRRTRLVDPLLAEWLRRR